MKVELRRFKHDKHVLLICETEEEAKLLDMVGKPDQKVQGQLRLADGYGEFYLAFHVGKAAVKE